VVEGAAEQQHDDDTAADADGPRGTGEADQDVESGEETKHAGEAGERTCVNPMHCASVATLAGSYATGKASVQRPGRGVKVVDARALWVVEPGRAEIREVAVPDPEPGQVLVRTLRSGISRGTEALVFRGGVPAELRASMRAPFQEGEFPGPVKYGYLNVGVVESGPSPLVGRTVFALYPHQTAYVVPADAVVPVPDDVPANRAVLAGTVETAVNALWDAAPLVGDRMTVVGGGMVGCCVARLLAGIPGAEVTLVDVAPARGATAASLGVAFALPDDAPHDQDVVLHTSGTPAGLQLSLDLLVSEGSVVDLSWYGDTPVQLDLGGRFHSERLGIRASQVGAVAAARRQHRTPTDRLALALRLLRDSAFDAVLTDTSPFEDLPAVVADLATSTRPDLCHVVRYP
jgi:threonine dehydrogenase-like Zn-dependent dehydrogenase